MEEIEEKRATLLCMPKVLSIDVEFNDIVYRVNQARGKKRILKGVSGCFKSGEITAIMGPSGAGKSSLLNILTGFTNGEGKIKCTGLPDAKQGVKQYRKHSCYILQDDCLDPLFTVEETMNFAAELKLGNTVEHEKKQILITEILEGLSLAVCRKTRCERISGGQKKRLSVALELIGNPSVMFLDEPTTGLDSLSSHQCISILKSLAQQGRNIVCTIHQPSATLFELFDFVYVLAEGNCVYQGSSNNVISYLASHQLNCPQYHNPADFLLEVANGDFGNVTDKLTIKGIENKWRNYSKAITEDKHYYIDQNEPPYLAEQKVVPEFPKFFVLVKRSMLKMQRDWTISSLKILLHAVVGIFLGITYLNSGHDGSKTVHNVGFFIVSCVYLCYTALMPSVLKFPSELNILKKERYNNWYNLKTYYMAFLIADIPMQILFTLAYIISSYILSAQPLEPVRFLMVILILSLVCLVSSSLGVVCGTVLNPVNGTFVGAVLTAYMLVEAGFLIFFTHMSTIMYAMSYLSYLSYAMEALVQSIYGYNRGRLPCPDEIEYCPYDTPENLLKEIGMNKPTYWYDVINLFCQFVALRILAYCTLNRRLKSV